MRKYYAYPTAVLMAVGLSIGLVTTQANATGPGGRWGNYCTTSGLPVNQLQCMNNTGGVSEDGNNIQYWAWSVQGEPNNDWQPSNVGTVRSGENGAIWPFDNGSGLNSRYDGDTVYQFHWAPGGPGNSNYCSDQGKFLWTNADGPLQMHTCSATRWQYFVWSGENYLVAVGASDNYWETTRNYNKPIWQGTTCAAPFETGNGFSVWVSNCSNTTWAFHGAHVIG